MAKVAIDWCVQQVGAARTNRAETILQAARGVEQMFQTSDVDQRPIPIVFTLGYWLVHVVAQICSTIEIVESCYRVPFGTQELRQRTEAEVSWHGLVELGPSEAQEPPHLAARGEKAPQSRNERIRLGRLLTLRVLHTLASERQNWSLQKVGYCEDLPIEGDVQLQDYLQS